MSNTLPPQKLAIYYSYPSLVNGSAGDVNAAATVFKDYQQVVFGAGLEDTSHPDHVNTISIINHVDMANTEVYGYIDGALALNSIQEKIDKWFDMGVKGIFIDKFGYDYGLTREKQREIVWCIHEKGAGNLKAFVNAWNPDDAFSPAVHTNNPNGLATRLGVNDTYLAESFALINGAYDDADTDTNGKKDFQDKAEKMAGYKTTFGTKLAAVSTYDNSAFDQNKADYSYFAATLNDFDTWGFGEQFFSASSAMLPFITRKPFYGSKFTGPVTFNGGVYERNTNIGIHINTTTHATDVLLD